MAKSPIELKSVVRSVESIPAVHIHFSRKMLILLAILLLSPCLIVTAALSYTRIFRSSNNNKPLTAHSDEQNHAEIHEGNPGPWGRLLYVHMMIDIPDEFVVIPPHDQAPVPWFFKDYSKERVIALLKSADVSQAQIDKFPDSAWQSEANGTRLTPGDELILALSPAARSKIYSILVSFPENNDHLDPVWFRPETLDKLLNESGLAESSIKLLKSLLYRNSSSSLFLFADKDTALSRIPSNSEKLLFVKTISRKSTLMARLRIDTDTDINALANYWDVGGRHKDILPLMSSLQRVEGGLNMSVIYLLPHFMRDRLYTYPFPSSDPQAPKQDCFWSAFNAFNSQTDDRFSDLQYVRQTLVNDYYAITQPSQLGDLVFLSNSDNEAMHVAVYVADDVVFTKNGLHFTQPWILMHLKDMVETYTAYLPPGKHLNVMYFRKKNI